MKEKKEDSALIDTLFLGFTFNALLNTIETLNKKPLSTEERRDIKKKFIKGMIKEGLVGDKSK